MKKNIDMTTGSVWRKLVAYAIPLLLGSLFQQLYSLADTWILGWFGNTSAYAAVGTVGTVQNVFFNFFYGLTLGAAVLISQHFGAKKYDQVQDAVHTLFAVALSFGAFCTVLGASLTPVFVRLMYGENGDPMVIKQATEYLMVYFIGFLSLTIYNAGANSLRAIGDAQRPLILLIICNVANIFLDVLFIAVFKWDAFGASLATTVSQVISAVVSTIMMLRTNTCVKLKIKKIRFVKAELGDIFLYGLPSALQYCITAFSNVFVNKYLAGANGNQTLNLAAWTTQTKIDKLMHLPAQTLGSSAQTFVAQNIGAGQMKRAKQGARLSVYISVALVGGLSLLFTIFAKPMASIFNPDPDVVSHAVRTIRIVTPFYLCMSFNQPMVAALRGSGNALWPAVGQIMALIVTRQIYLYIMTSFISNELEAVVAGFPVGWGAFTIVIVIILLTGGFGRKSKIQFKKTERAS